MTQALRHRYELLRQLLLIYLDPSLGPQLAHDSLLFAWQEAHEKFVQLELGTVGDRIRFEIQQSFLGQFENFPPIVRRILLDRPPGWEWRLAAELMRFLNRAPLRQIQDLRDGLYTKPLLKIDRENVSDWIEISLSESEALANPLVGLLSRLSDSFGGPGETGDASEILHICSLIRDYLQQVVLFEERLAFSRVPEEFETVQCLLIDIAGSQAGKLAEIPLDLDRVVELANSRQELENEEPIVIEKTNKYELPDGWTERFGHELTKASKLFFERNSD